MLLVTGVLQRVRRDPVNPPNGTPFERVTLVVADFGRTDYLDVARDFGALPAEGESVAVEVSVRTYKRQDGSTGYGLSALRRNSEAEAALAASSKGVRAVS